jgi:hypothetical protein
VRALITTGCVKGTNLNDLQCRQSDDDEGEERSKQEHTEGKMKDGRETS